MQWKTTSVSGLRFVDSFIATAVLVALVQFATAQSTSTEAAPNALTVRVSKDGSCQFLDASVPCVRFGRYLLERYATPGMHVHIAVDSAARYELIAATLKSFEGTGFKVGFVSGAAPVIPILISESGGVGYASVADALTSLAARRILSIRGINGEISFVEPDQKTTWTFVGEQHPAYPSVVRYVFGTISGPSPHVQIAVLCEASRKACKRFRLDVRREIVQPVKLMAMMSGDSTVKCQVDDETMKCGAAPMRRQIDQQVYVQIGSNGTCSIDSVETACLEIGKAIRGQHPSDNPRVSVCADRNLTYEAVGNALGALSREELPLAFGCSLH